MAVARAGSDGATTRIGSRAMGRSDDVEHFRKRALQEEDAARRSMSPAARKCHDQMAMMYRFKVAMLSGGPESWAECLVGDRQSETA